MPTDACHPSPSCNSQQPLSGRNVALEGQRPQRTQQPAFLAAVSSKDKPLNNATRGKKTPLCTHDTHTHTQLNSVRAVPAPPHPSPSQAMRDGLAGEIKKENKRNPEPWSALPGFFPPFSGVSSLKAKMMMAGNPAACS